MSVTIKNITQEFMVQHHTSSPYHPQVNGTVEAFNKILEWGLAKVCTVGRNDWDERIPVVLWAYQTTPKKRTKFTPWNFVYGREAVVLAEFLIPRLLAAQATRMSEEELWQDHLDELMALDEHRFLERHQQEV
jgi:transposase InsO family protein